VISGKKSKSGKVLFANDTHIGFSQPSVWYEAHIETPNLKLYGNFLAGIPFPIIGHTIHHAWGLTIFPNDAMDLYAETIKGNQVLYKNEWTNMSQRTEIIRVKNEEDHSFQVTSTPHGPIISDLKKFDNQFENPVAMYWVSNVVTDQKMEALWTLATATRFDELENASRLIDAPGLNIMYGDAEGNIGWIGAAKLIKRPPHVNSKIVLDGASGDNDPLGFYSFSNNPRNINPESGFVYSANNAPETDTSISIPGYYYSGTRAHVISNAISPKNDWDIEAMKTLVMNDQSPFYPENVRIIASLVSTSTDEEREALSTLSNWDGGHGMNELGPTIYYKLLYHILQKSWADEMGTDQFEQFLTTPVYLRAVRSFLKNDSSLWWDHILTEKKETRKDVFSEAFSQTVQELINQFGTNVQNWKWGNVHFIEHPHPMGKVKPLDRLFNVGPFPVAGGEEVINKMAFTLNSSGIYTTRSGPAMRILVDFADVENSISINPTGQSGYFGDSHYSDQSQMFIDGTFRKQMMKKDEIKNTQQGIWKFTGEKNTVN
jgi:penicillin amidase